MRNGSDTWDIWNLHWITHQWRTDSESGPWVSGVMSSFAKDFGEGVDPVNEKWTFITENSSFRGHKYRLAAQGGCFSFSVYA